MKKFLIVTGMVLIAFVAGGYGLFKLEKYRQGEVEWMDPPESIHLGTGNFIYRWRGDGVPTALAN